MAGMWRSVRTLFTAFTAVPIDTPGLRLNDTVTDGKPPWWLMTSGAVSVVTEATCDSGTGAPLDVWR